MKSKSKYYLLLHIIILIYSVSGVLSKLAGAKPFMSIYFFVFYALVLFMLMIYAFGWQKVIKYLPLTTAYANKAITVVWGIVFGILFFHETIEIKDIIGAVIIISGVLLYVRSDEEGEIE